MVGGGVYRSIVYNAIVKQGLKECLVYRANVAMTNEKIDYEELGVVTCAQQWKTANIRKCNPAGRFHIENKQQYCSAPPPPGKCWSGLNPQILSTDNKVTGASTNMLRKVNQENATAVRRIRDYKHIGLLLTEI